MGQRLNIEIKKRGKTLANCYYHWSAYSVSSLKLTKKIIEGFDTIKEDNDIMFAIRLLALTGAGLTRESISYLYKNNKGFDICQTIPSDNPFSQKYKYPITKGRNEGLIEVNPEQMETTRQWAEGTVVIDIDSKTFNFDVLFHISEEDKKDFYNDKKFPNKNIQLNKIPFEKINEYLNTVEECDETGDYNFEVDGNFYSFIA